MQEEADRDRSPVAALVTVCAFQQNPKQISICGVATGDRSRSALAHELALSQVADLAALEAPFF